MSPIGRPGFAASMLVMLFVVRGLAPPPAHAADTVRRVLVIHTTQRDTQTSILGDQMLPGLLERGTGTSIDYYAEYLDASRLADPAYAARFRDYLLLKYREVELDAIITMHAPAFDFMAAHRAELFRAVPVVFFTDSPESPRFANAAGVIAARDYRATLDLALRLQPETREVFVIVGNSPRDQAAERVARAQFASSAPTLRFTYLSGLSNDDVEERLQSMPEQAIGYYLFFHQDAAGVSVTPIQHLDRIIAIANRPVYSWIDATFGHGVLGGAFTSNQKEIAVVATLAVRVLRGEKADSIPILTANTTEYQVDWRELRRWDIDESRVPPGTPVLFRVPTAWERYKTYIVGVALLLAAQSALIGLLIVQRRRLRRAEDVVQRGQADLNESRERIRDLGGRLLAAEDAERSRIALELHDDVSQQLAALTMHLEKLCGVGPRHPDEAAAVAQDAFVHADAMSRSLRELSHRLYPTKLRLLGLVPALASLAHDMTTAQMVVRFTHGEIPTGLPHELTLALYRVVQEALRNAAVHSRAREVTVQLDARADALFLTVEDDGVGFDVDAARGRGLGLVSMRERLDRVGGGLTIVSTPGIGTRIEIVVAATGADMTVAV